MLNYEVCKRCSASVAPRPHKSVSQIEEEEAMSKYLKSASTHVHEWNANVVCCPKEFSGHEFAELTFVDEPIPEWCPHKFEHGVAIAMEGGDA